MLGLLDFICSKHVFLQVSYICFFNEFYESWKEIHNDKHVSFPLIVFYVSDCVIIVIIRWVWRLQQSILNLFSKQIHVFALVCQWTENETLPFYFENKNVYNIKLVVLNFCPSVHVYILGVCFGLSLSFEGENVKF